MALNFFLIACVVIFNSAAILLMKKGAMYYTNLSCKQFSDLIIWPGLFSISGAVLFYVMSLTLSIISLSRMDVSFFNPFISLTFVLSALGGYFFFNENISLIRVAGIFIIILGVVLVARSGQ